MNAKELCRVLIVDDEQLIRKGIIHYIDWEREGFSIVGEASNGKEALELIESVHPHIIITDIVMPIMDGEELTRIVKERYPEIEIIILSSFSEFDYVRSTFQNGVVDYILKPKLDAPILLKGLKAASSRIPQFNVSDHKDRELLSIDQMIHKLVSGYEVSHDEGLKIESLPFQYFYLLGVRFKNGSSDMNEMKAKIEASLSLIRKNDKLYSFSPNQSTLVFLINTSDHDNHGLIGYIRETSKLESGFAFALTEEFNDFFLLRKIYEENLLKLLNIGFYLPEQTVLTKSSLLQPSSVDKFNLDWFTEELKRRSFDSAFAYLKDYAKQLSRSYWMDIYEYKAFFSNIIFNITILLSNLKYDVKELENARHAYFKSIDAAHVAEEAVLLLIAFLEEAKDSILSEPNHQDDSNLSRLVEYMKEHYAESLTLTEVAKHFHFNPSYLSNYFSTHMNEGFIEYLNKIRIEKAANLLMTGTAAISEISAMVGYSDHSYFCKVFKKIKGLSPSQYKRKHK